MSEGRDRMVETVTQVMGRDGNIIDDDLAEAIVAALIEDAGGPGHIAQVTAEGILVRHPLEERFEDDDLFSCVAGYKIIEEFDSRWATGNLDQGRYHVTVDDDGNVVSVSEV